MTYLIHNIDILTLGIDTQHLLIRKWLQDQLRTPLRIHGYGSAHLLFDSVLEFQFLTELRFALVHDQFAYIRDTNFIEPLQSIS